MGNRKPRVEWLLLCLRWHFQNELQTETITGENFVLIRHEKSCLQPSLYSWVSKESNEWYWPYWVINHSIHRPKTVLRLKISSRYFQTCCVPSDVGRPPNRVMKRSVSNRTVCVMCMRARASMCVIIRHNRQRTSIHLSSLQSVISSF